jgi:hypothetical protein
MKEKTDFQKLVSIIISVLILFTFMIGFLGCLTDPGIVIYPITIFVGSFIAWTVYKWLLNYLK